MKKLIFSILTITVLTVFTKVAAQDVNAVFKNDTPITWVGIDFSGALFIGDREKFGTEEDIKKLIASWNTLMKDEYGKFNIGENFDKLNVEKAIEITKDHNADLIMTEMLSDDVKDHNHLSPENVQQILYSYDFGDRTGIGLMIVVESFDKLSVQGSMFFTFFDLATREILICERMIGKPGGFGLRNYWAGAIYSNLKSIQKVEFEMWRRKYQR
jgi:hypothetical protein